MEIKVFQLSDLHILSRSPPPPAPNSLSTTMSEFSLSSTSTKKTHLSTLLLSDLLLFCSFIFSHPLYFLYFIFFSPYLYKFLSFLSPLFITTSLLLLTLLTFSPNLVIDISHYSDFSDQYKVSTFMLGGACQALVERLRSKVGDGCEEFYEFEDLEAYKIVFDTSVLEIGENPVQILEDEPKGNSFIGAEEEAEIQQGSIHESSVLDQGDVFSHQTLNCSAKLVEKSVVIVTMPESVQLIAEEQEKRSLKEVKPLSVKTNKVADKKEEDTIKNGSNAIGQKVSDDLTNGNGDDNDDGGDKFYSPKKQNSPTDQDEKSWSPEKGSNNLGSFGSMRKEKEWRRTLACKLFEERHNAVAGGGDGGEDMDLLWETYESTDSKKIQGKNKLCKDGKKESNFGQYYDHEEEEEEEERDNAQLCCLQALKFSAGKMNLGMGKPSLVKISKALKGIGWLHHVSRSGKKVHNH